MLILSKHKTIEDVYSIANPLPLPEKYVPFTHSRMDTLLMYTGALGPLSINLAGSCEELVKDKYELTVGIPEAATLHKAMNMLGWSIELVKLAVLSSIKAIGVCPFKMGHEDKVVCDSLLACDEVANIYSKLCHFLTRSPNPELFWIAEYLFHLIDCDAMYNLIANPQGKCGLIMSGNYSAVFNYDNSGNWEVLKSKYVQGNTPVATVNKPYAHISLSSKMLFKKQEDKLTLFDDVGPTILDTGHGLSVSYPHLQDYQVEGAILIVRFFMGPDLLSNEATIHNGEAMFLFKNGERPTKVIVEDSDKQLSSGTYTYTRTEITPAWLTS